MKKILGIALIALSVMFPSFAADAVELDPFFVYSPRIMAQGGSFTAIASGHEALFTNPAGFASRGSLTLGSVTGWGFLNPKSVMDQIDAAMASGGEIDPLEIIKSQAKNGFGGGASLGVSFVGGGLGLGFIASTNLLVQGDTFPLGLTGKYSTTLAVVGGYAHTFDIGSTKLILGADLRPMIRSYSTIDASTISNLMDAFFDANGNSLSPEMATIFAALNGGDPATAFAYQGAGMGIDLGVKWELGSLTLGFSMRDLFNTKISMFKHGLGDYFEYLYNNAAFPSNEIQADGDFIIPMTINAGLAFHPDLGGLSFLIDPTFHVDLVDPIGVLQDGQSPWALLHMGTEVRVLRFIKVRGGINQGYVTGGLGMKILFLDLNASIFTSELGPYAGDQPSTGVSFEVALRF